ERRARGRARGIIRIGEAPGEFVDGDGMALPTQAIDEAPRVKIAAGELVERPRHEERQRPRTPCGHASGPSQLAQATGDSRKVTRSCASAPDVSGPSAP